MVLSVDNVERGLGRYNVAKSRQEKHMDTWQVDHNNGLVAKGQSDG